MRPVTLVRSDSGKPRREGTQGSSSMRTTRAPRSSAQSECRVRRSWRGTRFRLIDVERSPRSCRDRGCCTGAPRGVRQGAARRCGRGSGFECPCAVGRGLHHHAFRDEAAEEVQEGDQMRVEWRRSGRYEGSWPRPHSSASGSSPGTGSSREIRHEERSPDNGAVLEHRSGKPRRIQGV